MPRQHRHGPTAVAAAAAAGAHDSIDLLCDVAEESGNKEQARQGKGIQQLAGWKEGNGPAVRGKNEGNCTVPSTY